MLASKKGLSAARQFRLILGIVDQGLRFMAQGTRCAMQQSPLACKPKGIVEADDPHVGSKVTNWSKGRLGRGRGTDNKIPVVSLVERKGSVRSFPMKRTTAEMLKTVLTGQIAADARLMTYSYAAYRQAGKAFAEHATVDHGKEEYVRGSAHTNTVEGYFSLVKRGLYGAFHHISHKRLHRYLSEFDFRYNERYSTDGERARLALSQAEGKRLMYRPMVKARNVGLITWPWPRKSALRRSRETWISRSRFTG